MFQVDLITVLVLWAKTGKSSSHSGKAKQVKQFERDHIVRLMSSLSVKKKIM